MSAVYPGSTRDVLRRLLSRRLAKQLPIFRLIAVVQLALLARKHLGALTPEDRHRAGELIRRGRAMTPDERRELRVIGAKLEPAAFARAAAEKFSPVPLPGSRR
jgi:hypothetical protein